MSLKNKTHICNNQLCFEPSYFGVLLHSQLNNIKCNLTQKWYFVVNFRVSKKSFYYLLSAKFVCLEIWTVYNKYRVSADLWFPKVLNIKNWFPRSIKDKSKVRCESSNLWFNKIFNDNGLVPCLLGNFWIPRNLIWRNPKLTCKCWEVIQIIARMSIIFNTGNFRNLAI